MRFVLLGGDLIMESVNQLQLELPMKDNVQIEMQRKVKFVDIQTLPINGAEYQAVVKLGICVMQMQKNA
jgi:hypothetical protein